MGLAEHFGNVLGQEASTQNGESPPESSLHMKGWVKIPKPGKATCWERKFMKVLVVDRMICVVILQSLNLYLF